jgi:hypothetical protein
MRPIIFTVTILTSIWLLASFAAGRTAEPAARQADPWAGEYFKFSRYDKERIGQFGEAQKITITKGADGYYLSKPYADRKFTEMEKGVLSDGQGGLGKIYLGSAEFADGKRVPILRVEFCYEQFILYGEPTAPGQKPELKGKE